MKLIPVLDVMNGVVVRGIGGRRSDYRPIVSQLTTSTQPVEVAQALIEVCHARELYLADLDAIQGASPALDTYKRILKLGVALWVDAGSSDTASARRIADVGCHVVAGLETLPQLDNLCAMVATIGADRVEFSLDMRNGVPLGNWLGERPRVSGPWRLDASTDNSVSSRAKAPRPADAWPFAIATAAINCGVTRLIVLDLARVGGGSGTGTEDLCRQIASDFPHVELIAGGGVNGVDDLKRLAECGVRGVLVASALHDRRLPVLSTEY